MGHDCTLVDEIRIHRITGGVNKIAYNLKPRFLPFGTHKADMFNSTEIIDEIKALGLARSTVVREQ